MRRTSRLIVASLMMSTLIVTAVAGWAAEEPVVVDGKKYPASPITWVVGWGAGGGTDVFARNIGIPARQVLPVPLTIQNMPGAASAVATEFVAQQPADGYTLMNANPEILMNTVMKRGGAGLQDFVAVMRVQYDIGSLVVRGDDNRFPTIQAFLAYVKEHPGQVKVAGTGAASFDEVATMSFMTSAGVADKIRYVPIDAAGEMHAQLLGGHIDAIYEEPGVVLSMIDAKKMRPVVLMAPKRVARFPDLPAVTELGYKVPPGNWRGLTVRKGTPAPIVEYLHRVFKKAMESSYYKQFEHQRLLDLYPGYLGPKEFAELWQTEYDVYSEILTRLGYTKKQ